MFDGRAITMVSSFLLHFFFFFGVDVNLFGFFKWTVTDFVLEAVLRGFSFTVLLFISRNETFSC